MGRKARVDRPPEEEWQIVQERDRYLQFICRAPKIASPPR